MMNDEFQFPSQDEIVKSLSEDDSRIAAVYHLARKGAVPSALLPLVERAMRVSYVCDFFLNNLSHGTSDMMIEASNSRSALERLRHGHVADTIGTLDFYTKLTEVIEGNVRATQLLRSTIQAGVDELAQLVDDVNQIHRDLLDEIANKLPGAVA